MRRTLPCRGLSVFTLFDRLLSLRWSVGDPKAAKSARLEITALEDRSLPSINVVDLYLRADTGPSNTDRITSDPAVVGQVIGVLNPSYGVGVEVDWNRDDIPDDRTFPNEAGVFVYERQPPQEGPVAYRFRGYELNSATGNYNYGIWSDDFNFEYEYPIVEPPTITRFALYRDTGTDGDAVTADPRLTGFVWHPDGTSGLRIEFDFDDDGKADALTGALLNGRFTYWPAKTSEFSKVRVQARAWDPYRQKYVDSDWNHSLEAKIVSPPSDLEVIAAGLVLDTGPADLVTFDPRVYFQLGSATNQAVAHYKVAVDLTGNGLVDDVLVANKFGIVVVTPSNLDYGTHTLRAKYQEWDYLGGKLVEQADWTEFTFTFAKVPVPSIKQFKLKTDDGVSPNDGVSSVVTLVGQVDFPEGATGQRVEIKIDGVVDKAFVMADGSFEYEPYGLPLNTPQAIHVRASVWDSRQQKDVSSEWLSLPHLVTRTLPTVSSPTIVTFGLVNDTGKPGDQITSDPTLQGTLAAAGNKAPYVVVEFDHNSDGLIDWTAVTDHNGHFVTYPQGLTAGSQTIKARSSVFDYAAGKSVYSQWETFQFQYEPLVNEPPVIVSIQLKNDTGTPGDLHTTDPTVIGTLTNVGGDVAYLRVEIDEDGDETVDGVAISDHEGKFQYRPYSINPGPVTLRARAVEFDPITLGDIRSKWVEFSFTLEIDAAGTKIGSAAEALSDVVGTMAAAGNAEAGLVAAPGNFGLGIGEFVGVLPFANPNSSPLDDPLVLAGPWTDLPSSLSANIEFTAPLAGPITWNTGTYGIVFHQNGNDFVVDVAVSYSYQYTKSWTDSDGGSHSVNQDGTYQFNFHATGEFSLNSQGLYVVQNMTYSLSETSSMTTVYEYSATYTHSENGVTIAGHISTVFKAGTESYSRTDQGSVTFVGGANHLTYYSNSSPTTTFSGDGTSIANSWGTYSAQDPRSKGVGTFSFSYHSPFIYSMTQSGSRTVDS